MERKIMSSKEHIEKGLFDALAYLSRYQLSMTTHNILSKRGIDGVVEGELVHRGFISLVEENKSNPIYQVDLDWVSQHLKTKAAANPNQSNLGAFA